MGGGGVREDLVARRRRAERGVRGSGNVYGPRQIPARGGGGGGDLQPQACTAASAEAVRARRADPGLRVRRGRGPRAARGLRPARHVQRRHRRGDRRDDCLERAARRGGASSFEPELADLRPGELQHSCLDVVPGASASSAGARRSRSTRGCAGPTLRWWRSSASASITLSGEIAQLVEHTTENRGVPSSSLGLAIFFSPFPCPGASLRSLAEAFSPQNRGEFTEMRLARQRGPKVADVDASLLRRA